MVTTIQPRLIVNPNGKEEPTFFIPAFIEDNRLGLERDPDYEQRLMNRDKKIAEALRFGKWNVFAGQMFGEFGVKHKIAPFEIPEDWHRWRAVDWGFAAPFCCLWFTVHPNKGRIYVYREVYRAGKTDPEQARIIKENSLQREKYSFTFADPSMWERDTKRDVITSTAEVYQDYGVPLTKANNDQRNKISKTHAVLADMYDDLPGLQIFETCENLIRTLPAIMSDPNDPEKMLDGQEDHPWDTLAYGLTNYIPPKRPDEKVERKQQQVNPWMRGKR